MVLFVYSIDLHNFKVVDDKAVLLYMCTLPCMNLSVTSSICVDRIVVDRVPAILFTTFSTRLSLTRTSHCNI